MTKVLKLEMKGFKSFANKTELIFGDDFNVVLGPNGSGKSNILDSLCFVLGKSSAKGMRAEKSANLIYNGGKSKKGAKEGEVAIYFDNNDKTFPIEEDVVKVSRIIRPTGQSIYKINEKKHTRNEVIELLSAAKINPDGYNIILQGDIVRFVEMSPVERRMILEEIAGISVYEDKKNKANKELEKVDKSLNDAKIILTEREHYLKELKSERDQAMQFKDMEQQLKQNKATLIHISLVKKEQDLKEILEKMGSQQEKIDKVQEEIDKLKEQVKENKEKIQTINKEIEQRGEKEQVTLHKEVEQLRVDLISKQQRIKDLNNEIDRIAQRKEQLEESKKELAVKAQSIIGGNKDLKQREAQQSKLLKEVQAKIDAFTKKHNLNDAADIDKEIEVIDKEVEEVAQVMQELRIKQQDYIREQDRLEIQINNMDEKIEKVKQVNKEHKEELKNLQTKRAEFKKATLELSTVLSKDAQTNTKLSAARTKINKLRETEARLQARNASIQEKLGGSIAITKILNNTSLGDVRGTVSSLASVESKFATALEVAAGNKMNAIVVGSDAVASNCIKFLRQQQSGVATFLPLNKMKGRPKDATAQQYTNKPGCYGFAVDLVDFDSQYKSIFSYVFGSALVVESLETARKIGVGTVKMVTLDGDVVEKSGAMRGGFLKTKGRSSGFAEKEVVKDLKKTEADIAKEQELINMLEQQKQDNEQEIVQLREFKANLEGDIIKTEKSLHIDADDLDVSQNLKTEFREQLKEVRESFNEIQKQITAKNREIADKKTARQKLRDKIATLRNPTKLAELNSFQEKRQSLQQEIIQLQGKIHNQETQMHQIIDPEKENIDKILKQHHKEEEAFTNEQKQLKDQVKTLQVQVKQKEEQEQKFYAQFKESFNKRNSLQEQIESIEEKIIAKEEQIRSLEKRNNVVSIESARLKAEIAALNEEMEAFKEVEILKDKTEEDITNMKRSVSILEGKIAQAGAVNMKALDIYDKVAEEYEKLLTKREKLLEEKEIIHNMISEIETRKQELFLRMFEIINTNFRKIFGSLSAKGEAFLELEEPDSPFDGGVSVKVRLSGSKFMDIRSLSGGEKTMTALAFIFAIQENDPASFYIMDEVDAALDKRNSERLAQLIKAYSDRAQYIVISHNDGVISSANNLYGISMNEHGISKVVSLKV